MCTQNVTHFIRRAIARMQIPVLQSNWQHCCYVQIPKHSECIPLFIRHIIHFYKQTLTGIQTYVHAHMRHLLDYVHPPLRQLLLSSVECSAHNKPLTLSVCDGQCTHALPQGVTKRMSSSELEIKAPRSIPHMQHHQLLQHIHSARFH